VQQAAEEPRTPGHRLKNRLLLQEYKGKKVVCLQDEVAEVTVMTAPKMLFLSEKQRQKHANKSAVLNGDKRFHVDGARYKVLHVVVRTQITRMLTDAEKELRRCFPRPALLRAFQFIDLRYYTSEEAFLQDLQYKFAMLAEQLDEQRPGPVVSGKLLQEQSDRFFQVAAVLAHIVSTAWSAVQADTCYQDGEVATNADDGVLVDDELAKLQRLQVANSTAERHPAVRMWRGIGWGKCHGYESFSTMTFVKNLFRARQHVYLCVFA
jgi:hypothetical protein